MPEIDRRRALGIETAVLVLFGVLPSLVIGILYPGRAPAFWDAKYCCYVLVSALSHGSVVLFILWNSGDPLNRFGLVKLRASRDLPLAATLFIVYGSIVILPGKARTSRNNDMAPWTWWSSVPLSLILATVTIVAAASLEELLFRSGLVSRLEELLRHKWWAVVVSAVFFGLAHSYQGFLGVAMASSFGLLAGYIFVNTRSIWPTLIGHALVNCLWAFANR